MPYYTRAGDAGKTGICDQSKVSKTSPRIGASGYIDELNAAIGLCRTACKDREIHNILERIQNELFTLGADLCTPLDSTFNTVRLGKEQTERMEKEVDRIAEEIGELKSFILPGGTELAARLHLARTVCRKAERSMNMLAEKEKINPADFPYINRLSSLLFVLARLANKRANVKDVEWKK